MPKGKVSSAGRSGKLIPAVGYLRASTDRQDTCCDDQKTDIIRSTKLTHKIVAWYIDDGVSGWKSESDRKGFSAAIDHVKRGLDGAKTIIVWKQNRFSRFKKLRFLGYLNEMDLHGAKLHLLDHGVIDPEGLPDVLLALLRADADYKYCETLSETVKARMDLLAEKGYGLRAPALGYRHDGPHEGESTGYRLVINPHKHEAGTVRRIFKLALAGKTTNQIAKELNRTGIPTYSIVRDIRRTKGYKHVAKHERPYVAATWSAQQINQILRNPVYVGAYRWGRICMSEFHDYEKVVFKEGNHEAIVSPKDFRKVQLLIESRAPGKGRRKYRADTSRNALSGLLRCGWCADSGRPGEMHKLTGNESASVIYGCKGHKHGTCPGCRVNQSEVLKLIIPTIREYYHSADVRDQLAARIVDQLRPADARSPADLQAEITRAESDLKRILRNMARAEDDELPMMRSEKRSTAARIDELKTSLANAARTPVDIEGEAAEIVDECLAAFDELETAFADADMETVARVLNESIEEIVVWSERPKTVLERLWESLPRGPFTIADLIGDRSEWKLYGNRIEKLRNAGCVKVIKGRGGVGPGVYQRTKTAPPPSRSNAYSLVKGELKLRTRASWSLTIGEVRNSQATKPVVLKFGAGIAA